MAFSDPGNPRKSRAPGAPARRLNLDRSGSCARRRLRVRRRDVGVVRETSKYPSNVMSQLAPETRRRRAIGRSVGA